MLKYGVRLFSYVDTSIAEDPMYLPSKFTTFATASILRYVTFTQADSRKEDDTDQDILSAIYTRFEVRRVFTPQLGRHGCLRTGYALTLP